jgi:hypothetical protein
MAGATTVAMPVAKDATVTSPASPAPYAASSASARSNCAITALLWRTRISPAAVSRIPRPSRTSSWWPTSFSSAANCCDTADGVR